MIRLSILGLALVAASTGSLAAATLLPPGCLEELDADVTMPSSTFPTHFLPPCVVVPSGGTVHWTSEGQTVHAVESSDDDGTCFTSAYLGHAMRAGDTFEVRFTYDGDLVTAWIDGHAFLCNGAANEQTEDRAVIDYVCSIHPNAGRGTVVVLRG